MTGSSCSLTRLPHSKVALQVLQSITVWSCSVWFQTKHQQDSGTTSDHQTGLRVILTSFTRGGRRRTQMDSDIPHFVWKSWRFAIIPDVRVCVCSFLILEHSPRPCGKCITPGAYDYLQYVHGVHSLCIQRRWCRSGEARAAHSRLCNSVWKALN